MTTMQTTEPTKEPTTGAHGPSRTVTACGVSGAVLAAAAVAVLGDPLRGASSGADVTDQLLAAGGRAGLAAVLAGVAAALLVVVSLDVGARTTGLAGRVVAAGGCLLAVLTAMYFAAFGGGALVGTQVLDEVGAGLGEATLVGANTVALTRYAAGVLLLGAVAAAALRSGRHLPRWAGWSAVVLLVLFVVPVTGWAVALVLPVWLGILSFARTR